MDDGDFDTWLAYHCFVQLKKLPSEIVNLTIKEKITLKVFIEERIQAEKKASQEAKRKQASLPSKRR